MEEKKATATLKKITLLHSNDMHGDFMAERIDDSLVGGVSMLSGYLQKVRNEETNVIYAIAGDMFRGSVIDSEFKGLSTIELMNMLQPDVVTIGNHEVDYGISHLLFLEKCANFPIINANLYLKPNHKRLFSPCHIIEMDGMKILFIGILTECTLLQCKQEDLVGEFVDVEDAVKEVEIICNSHNAIDIDFTVLLTHIGLEEDKKLAAALHPSLGVDVIIGGHSHSYLTEPVVVNGIPIVQAGTGTDQIGRFDLLVDTEHNRIHSFTWQSVPIDAAHCPSDPEIEYVINDYKTLTDHKYDRILTRFRRELTHPDRNRETELGHLFSDMLKDALGVDIFLCGSGSIRSERLGPVVTLRDLKECFPYDNIVHMIHMTGAQLKHALLHMLRDDALMGLHTEFYQLSRGLVVEYDQETRSFLRFDYEGEPVEDDRYYTVGLEHFHFKNLPESFLLTLEDVCADHEARIISTSCVQIIEEALAAGHLQDAEGSGRLTIRYQAAPVAAAF